MPIEYFHSPPQGWRQEASTQNPDSPMPSKGWLGGGDCYTMPFLGMYCINNLHIREKHSSALISLFSRNQNGEIAKFLYDPTLVRICTYWKKLGQFSGQLGPTRHNLCCSSLLETIAVPHDRHKKTLARFSEMRWNSRYLHPWVCTIFSYKYDATEKQSIRQIWGFYHRKLPFWKPK